MDKLKIVIADDERLFLQGISALVEARGDEFSVVGTAANGEDALKTVRECRPDILLTDIRMPRMDGIELIKQIESRGLSIVVILISAYDDREYIQYAIRSPIVYDYINKPFSKEEFNEMLSSAAAYRRRLTGTGPRPDAGAEATGEPLPSGRGEGDGERKITVLVAACLDIIDRRLEDSSLSVSEVARELDVTDNYLSSRFSRDMDVSFTRYVTMVRIERAKEYLKDPRLKIYAISEKLGFNDPKYFVKVFKEYVGMRPSEYREQLMEK